MTVSIPSATPASTVATPASPVRVLHVMGPLDRGGMEVRTVEMMRRLDRDRFRVDFFSVGTARGALDEEVRSLGGEVHRLALGPAFPRRFRRLLRERRYDVVHSHLHQLSGLLVRLAAAERVPGRVAHFRAAVMDFRKVSPLRRLRQAVLRRWIDKYATDILGVSEGALDLSWDPDWRADPRCRVIYNGIDTAPFEGPADREGVRDEFGLGPADPLLIHVGRMDPCKNHARVVETFAGAAAALPSAALLLVGRAEPRIEAQVRRVAEARGVAGRLRIAGERTDVARLLKASDLMVFPSLHEGLPGAVLEACAADTPVLASDLPSVREIAAQLPGVYRLSLSDSADEWSRKVVELLRMDRAEAAGAGGAGSAAARFERSVFSMRRCVDAHCGIWERRAARA